MRTSLLMLIVSIMLFVRCANNSPKETEEAVDNSKVIAENSESVLTETIDSIQKANTSENINEEIAVEKAEETVIQTDVLITEEIANPIIEKKAIIKTLDEGYQVIKDKFDHVPFYFETSEKPYFIVVNGKWDRYSLNRRSGRNKFRMGMVDVNGNEVLPVELSGIHNPGIFSKKWIEIEKNNQSGFFNLENGQLIEPQFDLVIPSTKKNSFAIAKKNNSYFSISPKGEVSPVINSEEIPQFMGLEKGMLFRTTLPGIVQMHLTKMIQKKHNGLYEGTGVVFTPSYIKKLNVMYESFQGIVSSETKQGMEFGTVGGISQVAQVLDITPDIKAFFVKFHTSGVDIDEYSIDKEKVVTINRNNEVIDSKNVLSSFNNEKPFCKNSNYSIKDNSLIEIVKYAHPAEEFQDYSKMPNYTYKRIGNDGKVKLLSSDRFFDFTQFVKIDGSYFNDCLLKNNDPNSPDYVAGKYNLLMMKHYDTEDLQIMIQEIYAGYGKIFTNKKWKEYFGSKPWYKPLTENVNNQLSEIDQYNIAIIQNVIDKMEGKEDDFIKKDALIYAETEF